MKNIKKTAFYCIVFIQLQHSHSLIASGAGSDIAMNAGVNACDIVVPALKESAATITLGLEKLGAVGAKDIAAALPNAGANFGANFGVGLADKVGVACSNTGVACSAAYAKASAVVLAHPVITTIVVGTVVVVIIAYGSYKIYKYYYRTTDQQVSEAKKKLEIAQAQAAIMKMNAIQEKSQKETALKAALIQNASSPEKTASGIPVACLKHAQELAIVAGQKKVNKITAAFVKYSPQSQAAMATRA